MISGANVLITGGVGSVGQALTERFLSRDPTVVRLLDNSEPALAEAKEKFDDDRCRFLLGDVRDERRLERAMEDIDVVVHAAAMKHVDISEYNPFEAVKTNVVGLQNTIDTAIDANVERLVFTSSDKAVNPANTMGTTKLLGEKLVTAGNKYKGSTDPRLASVRFGNVVDSSMSVVPVFAEQIRDGGPVTLTSEEMTRFFLTYDDVERLVVGAMKHTERGEVFVNKMNAVRISDLATAMVEMLAPTYGYEPGEIDIRVVGRRVGETFHEEIATNREERRAIENESMYVIPPETADDERYLDHSGIEGFDPVDELVHSSADAEKLSHEEIIDMLRRAGVSGA